MTNLTRQRAERASIQRDPNKEVVMRGVMLVCAMMVGCGTVPGVSDGSGEEPGAAQYVVHMPDDAPKPVGMERLPLVEVYGRVGLGQCGPCITDAGHGCCGTDGWIAPVACGNAQGYMMDCRQVPTGCGQTLVAGVRVCE